MVSGTVSDPIDEKARTPVASARQDAEAAALRTVGRSIPLRAEVHRLTPSQSGAVGHVVGVRGMDDRAYALKIYPAGRSSRVEVEATALRRLARLQLPVPTVFLHGTVDGDPAAGYVLMSWLPGVRWAECAAEIGREDAAILIRRAGTLLRRMHSDTGAWFGNLLREPGTASTATDIAAARLTELLPSYESLGGPGDLAQLVGRFVRDRSGALRQCPAPVLCHNDFVDGNLMVRLEGRPDICGVFDLERASWGDPMNDLAMSAIHLRYHYPDLVHLLVDSYGVDDDHELVRLQVYEALHVMDERCWIASDRPHGWQRSIAALDDRLRAIVAAG